MDRKEYLVIDGRKICLIWNFDVMTAYFKLIGYSPQGMNTIPTDMQSILKLAWCAARAGERCEGRELIMSPIEFKRLITPLMLPQVAKALTALSIDEDDYALSSKKLNAINLN
jgi:hypothetical protein